MINDLYYCLAKYCKRRGLADDPLSCPLSELPKRDRDVLAGALTSGALLGARREARRRAGEQIGRGASLMDEICIDANVAIGRSGGERTLRNLGIAKDGRRAPSLRKHLGWSLEDRRAFSPSSVQ